MFGVYSNSGPHQNKIKYKLKFKFIIQDGNSPGQDCEKYANTQRQHNMLKIQKWHCIFLPSGEGGDEEGGLEDLAGGNGMCGRGLREVGTRWRDCEVMEGERHIKLQIEDKAHAL